MSYFEITWWLSWERICLQCRSRFDPWVGKILWKRSWQPTPVSCLENPHGQRRLVGCSPWESQRVWHDWATKHTPHSFSSAVKGHKIFPFFFIVCCCFSVAKLCPTLCHPMDCSTPGFLFLPHLLEFAQTHVHWVSDAIQPPHPLSSPSPPAFNHSQHQSLFQWFGSFNQIAKVLDLQL